MIKKTIIKSEVNYIDNKINWVFKSYYSNGQLKEEVNYIDEEINKNNFNILNEVFTFIMK